MVAAKRKARAKEAAVEQQQAQHAAQTAAHVEMAQHAVDNSLVDAMDMDSLPSPVTHADYMEMCD